MHIIAMTKHPHSSQCEELEKHSCANINIQFVSAFDIDAGVVVKSFKACCKKKRKGESRLY